MNTLRFSFLHLLSLTSVIGLLLAAPSMAVASAEQHVDDGLTTAKSWVAMIDNGEYDESYSAASGAMHDKIAQDRWDVVLKALRTPWGPVVTRQQLSHIYKPDGFEGSEGEFLVITYDSSFKKADAIKEVIVLRWEDGQWRAAGYNAGPKGNPDGSAEEPAPSSTTDVQTQEHVKPTPQ